MALLEWGKYTLKKEEKKKKIAEDGFDPSTSGLWAQHAPTAPLCYVLSDVVISYFNESQEDLDNTICEETDTHFKLGKASFVPRLLGTRLGKSFKKGFFI